MASILFRWEFGKWKELSSVTFGNPWLAGRGQVSSLGILQKRKNCSVFGVEGFL